MKANVSRRSLLAGVGYAAAGSVAGQLWSMAQAQEAAPAQHGQANGLCLTMIFEDKPKVKFDWKKYAKNHLPMLRDVYGDSVERIELRTTNGAEESSRAIIATYGGRFAVRASTTFWIRDVEAFGQKLAANSDRINQDLDKLASGNRLVQMDRVVLGLGDARSAVEVNDELVSNYFLPYTDVPNAPTFDQRYYVQTYLPKLYSLLGSKAVSRVEATVGMEQAGRKPAQVAGFQIFIRNDGAFQDVSRNASVEVLQKDTPQLTQHTMLLITNMRVAGIA